MIRPPEFTGSMRELVREKTPDERIKLGVLMTALWRHLYRAPSGLVNLDWLRLCPIDPPGSLRSPAPHYEGPPDLLVSPQP
jgi:hypothetical protein